MGNPLRRRRPGNSGGGGSTTAGKHTAPTPGLENVVFTHGTPQDAATYEDVVKQVTKYLGSQNYKGVAKLRKALETLTKPELVEPTRPKRQYWTTDQQVEQTTTVTKFPVVGDQLHALDMQIYLEDKKTYREDSTVWEENQTRAYSIFELHCPESLIEDLKVFPKWEDIETNHNVIELHT